MKRYPKYKESGLNLVGAIPAHWTLARGDGLFDYRKETVVPDVFKGREVLHYSIPAVQEFGEGQIEAGATIASSKLKLSGGELLISKLNPRKGTVTLVASNHPFMICSSEFVPLVPVRCDRRFAYYLYSCEPTRIRLSALVDSATKSHQRAEPSEIYKMWNAFPPLDEQRSIASFLDRKTGQIDILIRNKQALIDLLREQRAALINRAVTKGLDPGVRMKDSGITWLGQVPEDWSVTRLRWITSKIGSGSTPRGGAEVYQRTGVPILRSQNVQMRRLTLDDVAFIAPAVHEAMDRSAVLPNDVLINITGASIGRCAAVPRSLGPANVNQHVCIVRPGERVLTSYLELVLSSSIGQHQVLAAQDGSSREGLNFEQLGNFVVPLPGIAEQEAIVFYFQRAAEKVNAVLNTESRVIERLRELRTSLVSEVVTGKIDIRNSAAPADEFTDESFAA